MRKPKEEVTTREWEASEASFNRTDTTDIRIAREQNGVLPLFKVPKVLQLAAAAEQRQDFGAAAYQLAWAIIATRSYGLRDSLENRLRALVRNGAWGPLGSKYVDSSIARALDSTFQAVYDRDIPITRAPAYSGRISNERRRIVLAEYLTGTQCGICWEHDRIFSALLQRYATDQVVVIGYHDGPGFPIARPTDSLNKYIGGIGKDSASEWSLYPWVFSDSIAKYNEWIDGTAHGDYWGGARQPPAFKYNRLSAAIDARINVESGASISLVLKTIQSDIGVAKAVHVSANVTTFGNGRDLGVRFVLVQDTVRVTGYTPRRLQYMAARTVAWFRPKQMFYPLADDQAQHTVSYTFDLDSLQLDLLRTFEQKGGPDSDDAKYLKDFPSKQDWILNRNRLAVVAIVQNQKTREVLQTVYMPVK